MRTVIPLAVLFDVSPKDIEIGHDVTLNATLMRTDTNTTLTGYQPMVRFYDVSSSSAVTYYDVQDNNTDGKVYRTLTYSNDGCAHAYKAEVIPYDIGGGNLTQSIVSSPVQLTASKTTRFILNASREYSSTMHTVYGWLKSGESGVNNTVVKLKINETEYSVMTNGSGYFSKTLDLKPVDGAPSVYEVMATFEDNVTLAVNCTAWSKTPDGLDYAACTTVQYGYKPATKSLSLTVTYESTTVIDPDSPEQLQQETGEWLSIWHEFTLSYPWYRLHIVVRLGDASIDVGYNPILPFSVSISWAGMEWLAETVSEITSEIWQDVTLDFIGVFASYIIAKGLSIWNLVGGLIVEAIKGGIQYGLFLPEFFRASSDSLKMLATGIANLIMGLVALATDVGFAFVKALQGFIWSPTFSCIMMTVSELAPMARPLEVMHTAVDYVESVAVDFPIAVLAFLRYLGCV